MFEYKVIAGKYQIDGSDVVVENPLGRGTMQRILDHYASEGFELIDTHFDNLNHELIMTLRKGQGVVMAAAPQAASPAHVPEAAAEVAPARAVIDDDGMPVRRRGRSGSGGGKRRRSKAELDRLARE